ncbi:cytochrome P450 monooxygenase-like protein [Cladochytrium replicatum]|nr:cytochrome P450 monooxygenase-like protein [Cladochytrium replicatum]
MQWWKISATAMFLAMNDNNLINWALGILACLILSELARMIYNTKIHPLKKVPGPWIAAATPLWIAWQRWNGRLSLTADALLTKYGPVVRISPSMVLINDGPTVSAIFSRRELDTAPKAVRALRVGSHDWTVTYPQNHIARERRHPVMIATTTKHLKYWRKTFEKNIGTMIHDLIRTGGTKAEDIVHHLRICTLRNSQVIMGGSGIDLDPSTFPAVVGEYNFLVIWRLCLPEWLFTWLEFGPFRHSQFRVKSSDLLYDLGAELCRQAKSTSEIMDDAPNVYQMFTDKKNPKGPATPDWTDNELSAEMAGQILAATETTSSALTFILYELTKNPKLMVRLHEELGTVEGNDALDSLPFLDACIREGLRFRPPVALTGSRLVPFGGMDVLGYHVPAGTVLTTQSLSMSRQRPDLFPQAEEYDPTRWIEGDEKLLQERRALLVPFGVGARRCPGGNMAIDQMRLLLAALVRTFEITLAPETTPEVMAPFEANGYRSRTDSCHMFFTPRVLGGVRCANGKVVMAEESGKLYIL